ncbi:hypothetical protein OFM39_34965, partial [Escherichia coli]|nr:hypothetical protein [Escherichia coli]
THMCRLPKKNQLFQDLHQLRTELAPMMIWDLPLSRKLKTRIASHQCSKFYRLKNGFSGYWRKIFLAQHASN